MERRNRKQPGCTFDHEWVYCAQCLWAFRIRGIQRKESRAKEVERSSRASPMNRYGMVRYPGRPHMHTAGIRSISFAYRKGHSVKNYQST